MSRRQSSSNISVPAPTADGHATNKKYVEDRIAEAVVGDVTIDSIQGLRTELNNRPLQSYVDSGLSGKLDKGGVDAKGDILVGTGDDAVGRLPVSGNNGRVLAEDSSQTTGLAWVSLSKASVGLGDVDNTSDEDKPVSVAQQAALDDKEDSLGSGTSSQYLRGDKTFATLDKSAVGLSNVDNTADSAKPVSSAQQTALDGKQDDNADLTAIAGLTPTNNDLLQRKSGAWTNRTPAQVKTDLSLSKSDVGLSNVDNTADSAKPISSATQTALDGKEAVLPGGGTTAHYLRGDKTWVTLNKAAVGLGNVDNTADSAKPVSSAQQTALDGKQDVDSDLTAIAGLSATNDDFIQRKSGAWTNRTVAQVKTDLALTKSDVGLGNVDNTSDASKPISSATQTALDGKQGLNTNLTTIGGLTPTDNDLLQRKSGAWINRTPAQVKTDLALAKADVGLGNVDNTSDATKNSATATLANKTLTAPRIADMGFIADPSGNEYLQFDQVASAVNQVIITNAVTTAGPSVGSAGGDTNIDLNLTSKGTGRVKINGVNALTASSTDTLTNKTIDGTTNTLSNIDQSAVTGLSTALSGKEPQLSPGNSTQYYRGDKSWQTLDKTAVGLGNVDNTADSAKPVSSAQQTALDGKQASNSNLTAISGLSPTNDDILQRKSGAWTNRTMAQLKTDLSLTKTDVGLGSADNTADSAKNVLSATKLTTARTINGVSFDGTANITVADSTRELAITAGTTSQYWRGDKSWQTLDKSAVGLGNVDNTSDSTKNSATATLTNKRVTPRVLTVSSTATPAINTDSYDFVTILSLATNITSMTSGLTGTPTDGQKLMIKFKDNGTSRTIAWGTSFQSSGVGTLLAATVINKIHHVGLIWDAGVSKWVCLAVDDTGY